MSNRQGTYRGKREHVTGILKGMKKAVELFNAMVSACEHMTQQL